MGRICLFLVWCLIFLSISASSQQQRLKVLFVHTSIPGSCGPLPDYLKATLLQAKKSQYLNQSDVILLSNFKQCRWALHDLQNGGDLVLRTLMTAESFGIKSERTLEWEKMLKTIIPKGGSDEDILFTSLYRFFMLEDYMSNRNLTSNVLQLESDSFLYGDLSLLLPQLRRYPKLALNPSIHKKFLSASVLWVGDISSLRTFNNFLLSLGRNGTGELIHYTEWLREFACCKTAAHGGLFADEEGHNGIKPWAVSDKTLLAYYRHLHHREIALFPILPHGDFKTELGASASTAAAVGLAVHGGGGGGGGASHHPHHVSMNNVSLYSVGGAEVGPDTGGRLFDSGGGGWGAQFSASLDYNHLSNSAITSVSSATAAASAVSAGGGGASLIKDAAPSWFADKPAPAWLSDKQQQHHGVVEQAAMRFNCSVAFRCVPSLSVSSSSSNVGTVAAAAAAACATLPHVACGTQQIWTPLWTIHVEKERRIQSLKPYISEACPCP